MAGRGDRRVAQAVALLSERHYIPQRAHSTASDLLSAVDEWHRAPPHVQRVARDIETTMSAGGRHSISDDEFQRAILAGYPDRVGARREPGSARVRLATGTGAVLAQESGVREGDWLVAVDVQASTRADQPDSRIRMANRIELEWLQPTSVETVHRFHAESGTVRAARIERYDALVLGETPVAADPVVSEALLAAAWLDRGLTDAERKLSARLRFAGRAIDVNDAAPRAASGARSLKDVNLVRAYDAATLRALDVESPETIVVPSGRAAALEYRDDGTVMASVKLQELFGLADTPRVGKRREPILLALLAPNGRPVQVTRDLRSFWDRTYPEVRRELRGRYPKHPWPEDPWNAPATARAKRRGAK